MAKPFKVPESVLVVVHTASLQVLLIRRVVAFEGQPEFWQSVTGSLDTPGEDLRLACAREVFEETGIQAAPEAFADWQLINRYEIYPVWRHRYAPGVTHNTEHVFALQVDEGTPVVLNPGEHTAWQWLPWREAADCCFSASNAEALLQLPARARA
jgi:dATP pyrophosphohydrolase